MRTIEQLARELRTFWLRDIGAIASSNSGTNSDGSVALGRTLFIPNAGGLVGINQIPTDPYVLDVLGHSRFAGHLYPYAGNQWTLGVADQPWSAAYISELSVGTLVSENKITTIGGRILVTPRATLILAVTTGATTIDVSTNAFTSGDRIYLESTSKVEWMAVTSSGTAITGGYRFSVTRNLDGSGANTWAAGDTIMNTGTTGNGFIDIFSRYGIPAAGETSTTRVGPSLVGMVRTGTAFDAISTRWAVGNLYGLYDYGAASKYGLAAGQQSAAWFSVDETNGVRFMNASTMLGQWSAAGGITVGQVAASKSNILITSGQLDLRLNTTSRMTLTSAGVLTIRDSGGAAVFTFDASAGAEFTKPLTLGAAGGIYQGSGSFATPTTGLKIWNPTGGATDGGKIGGYNGGTLQWYANTDGKLYAGAGAVTLDASGITLTKYTYYVAGGALKWGDDNNVIYGYTSGGGSNVMRLQLAQPNTAQSSTLEMIVDGGSVSGTGQIDLTAAGSGLTNSLSIKSSGSTFTGALRIVGTLKFAGATSGTATITAPAIAGTPTLTLPTTSGTFALTSDLTTAISGTSGTIAKFTGPNTIGNSILSESGAVLTLAGSLKLAAEGIYIGGTTSPANVEVQRTLPAAATSYVEIGSLDIANGAHNLRISVTVTAGGHSIAKQYAVSTKYAQTGGAWHYVLPVSDSGLFNYDFDLIVNQSATSLALRLYQRVGASNADVHYIRIESVGLSTDVFTAASASSTMTAPSVALASSMDFKAKALYLSRTIPTTVGNYVGIGTFGGTPLGHILEVDISNSDGGFAVAKHFIVASTYGEAGANAIIQPVSSTGAYSSNDYALVGVQSGSGIVLYLLRTQGTTAGTATVAIRYIGAPSVAFTESTATGSMSVPTVFYPSAVFTQADGKIGVNVIAPAATLHVVGAADNIQAIVKANATQTTSLQEWQNSSGTMLAKITGTGKLQTIASTTSDAALNMPAGPAPSSPVEGDAWNDSTQFTIKARLAGITQNLVGTIFTGTADATCGNTLTETSLMPSGVGTLTLPANFWKIGKTIRIKAWGRMSKGTTSVTRKYSLLLGAVTIKTNTTAAGTSALTNDPWQFDALLTCRTTGGSGTIMAQMRQYHAGVVDPVLTGTATVTIDTTASAALDYKFQWSALDAANSMTLTNIAVEVLN